MALQICPVCKKEAFTWFMTEDEAGREVTGWGCHSCEYWAYENEAYNSDGSYRFEQFTLGCTSCGSTKALKLHKDGKEYLWCSSCHLLTEQPAP